MRETRLYGLFEKQSGKWIRLYPELAFKKSVAIRFFQNSLLGSVLSNAPERSLRPVEVNRGR